MRPAVVVVTDLLAKDGVEITPAEDHHSVEARDAQGASHVRAEVVIRGCTEKWTTLGT